MNGNTALWEAISSKHHSIFRTLYHCSSISDPFTAADLLCTAAKRNDVGVMKELLKQGLNVDAKDRQGSTALQIALTENNVDMANLLVMNGADVSDVMNAREFDHDFLNEMLRRREVGHQDVVPDSSLYKMLLKRLNERDGNEENSGQCKGGVYVPRVSIYRGHPLVRKETSCVEPGKVVRLPSSLEELKNIAGTVSYTCTFL